MSAGLLRDNLARTANDKQQQLCQKICHSTGQLLAFVKAFLANSAADHGIDLKPETINLGNAVVRAVEDYREAARRKDLELCVEVPVEVAIVHADRRALDQVLDNLLSNAVKFSLSGRRITALVRQSENVFECLIQDQGPGFTAEDQARMFRRYGRLSARPTAGEPSTGLGLSIVKKLVQAMQGELICESATGQGATFIVRLPRAANAQD